MENKPVYLVITSARVQKDIVSAWEWYEERQIGLGEKLIDEVNSKI